VVWDNLGLCQGSIPSKGKVAFIVADQSTDTAYPPQVTRFVGFYSVVLMVLYNLAAAGLISVPVSFFLMNKLHLTAVQQSTFSLITDMPYFVGFAFGFLRDRWRPLGKGDRGYFVAAPLLMASVYIWMAFTPISYGVLVIGYILIAIFSSVLGAAAQGLLAAIGKDFGMMGRLAVVALVTVRGGMMYTAEVGGWLGDHAAAFMPYVLSAAVCLTVILMAFWRPKTIFRSGDEVFVSVIPENAMAATKRLLRHKAVYLPALCLFFFEFAPGWGTPLLFFLTKTVKLTEEQFGTSQAYLRFGQIAAALSYSWLCTRFRIKPLLNWGTLLAVIGGPALLLIHTGGQANIVNLIAGICCGVALASYYDLLVRCCPKELEGVAFMLSAAAISFAGDVSDIVGSWLYEKGGFALALIISTAVTALIFIPVLFLPKAISDPHEGERIIDADPPALLPEPA
jgi:MFS family permease